MARQRSGESPQRVVVRSIALTPQTLRTLEALATQIAGRVGKKTSVSAVVRALLHHIEDVPHAPETLAPIVEHEQAHEVVWGKPPTR